MDTNNSDCLNWNQAKTSETFHMVIGYRHKDKLSVLQQAMHFIW